MMSSTTPLLWKSVGDCGGGIEGVGIICQFKSIFFGLNWIGLNAGIRIGNSIYETRCQGVSVKTGTYNAVIN